MRKRSGILGIRGYARRGDLEGVVVSPVTRERLGHEGEERPVVRPRGRALRPPSERRRLRGRRGRSRTTRRARGTRGALRKTRERERDHQQREGPNPPSPRTTQCR